MQDPRALANPKNLTSYRAWEREGCRRSGYFAVLAIVPLLALVFTLAATRFAHATADVGGFVALTGAAFALYLAVVAGLMIFAVLRLRAWRRAHPWAAPASHAS